LQITHLSLPFATSALSRFFLQIKQLSTFIDDASRLVSGGH
jgi:hypothetical protein